MKDSMQNCYEIAGRLIGTMKNTAFLCNGYIFSTKLKRLIKHAWVEDDRSVWDYSNSRRLILKKTDYYLHGRVERVIRYSRLDAIKMMQGTNCAEFWSPEQRMRILGRT